MDYIDIFNYKYGPLFLIIRIKAEKVAALTGTDEIEKGTRENKVNYFKTGFEALLGKSFGIMRMDHTVIIGSSVRVH